MDPRSCEPAIHDERRGVRFPLPLKLQMQWGTPDASTARLPVWGLNISGLGAAFITDHPLPLSADVYLELPQNPVRKAAKVRNCKRWGAGWRVGVEFDLKLMGPRS
jgi:hypothetical protein